MADETPAARKPPVAAAPTLGSVARGGRALFARYVLAFAVSFGGGVVLARLLGPATMAMYFVSAQVLAVLREFVELGGRQYLVQVSGEPDRDEVRTVATLQHAAGLVGVGVTCAVYPFLLDRGLTRDALILVVSAAIGAFFMCWQSVPTAVLERRLRYARVGAVEFLDTFAFYAAAVGGGLLGYGIWALAAGNVIRGLAPAILSWMLSGWWPGVGIGLKRVRATIAALTPFVASRLAFWVVLLVPPVIYGIRSDKEAYGLAQQGMAMLGYSLLFPTILYRVAFGALSRLQHDDEKFRTAFRRCLELVCLLTFPMAIGVFSIAAWWSPLIFGPKWAGLERVFVVGSIPTALEAVICFMDAAVIARGGAGLCARRLIVHAAVFVPMLAILAPSQGALALPMANLVALMADLWPLSAYRRLCGPLALGRYLLLWLAAGLGGWASYEMTKRGWVPAAVALWFVLPALWIAASRSARAALRTSLAGAKEM